MMILATFTFTITITVGLVSETRTSRFTNPLLYTHQERDTPISTMVHTYLQMATAQVMSDDKTIHYPNDQENKMSSVRLRHA